MSDFVEMVLGCGSWQEAQRIADVLLEKRLVARVEMMEVKATDWLKHGLGEARKIKLLMESAAENLEKIEHVIKFHQNKESVELYVIPIEKLANEAVHA